MSALESPLRLLLNNIIDPSQLIFVVGAGMSVSSGHRLWGSATELAVRMAKDRGLGPGATAYSEEKLAATDYYAVFDILARELPEPTYYQIAEHVFAGSNEATEMHRQILRITGRGIITTNFDQCLLSACILERKGPPVTDMAQATASNQFFIVNPHGSILSPRSMVLNTADWLNVESNGQLLNLLSQLVSSAQFVFLGYSMRDPDFNKLWDRMLRTKFFRSPAIYVAAQGAIEPARRQQFRDRHVQVIEFPDDGSFAFLSDPLSALAGHSLKATSPPSLPVAYNPNQDLERYVLMCLQFSPTRKSRLVLVTKALVLERLAKSTGDAVMRPEVLSYVSDVLGQDVLAVQDATNDAIADLSATGIIRISGQSIAFDNPTFEDLNRKVARLQKDEEAWIQQTLSTQAERLGLKVEADDHKHVGTLLDKVLLELGREVAELLLFNRLPEGEADRIEEIVLTFRDLSGFVADREELYKKTLKRLVLEPGERHEEALFKRLQAYFISTAYILNAASEKLLADYAKDHWVYLDSSIILPALAVGHPASAIAKSLLHTSRNLGMKLRVIRDMVNEVWANIRTAKRALDEFATSGVPLTDVLEGYVALHGPSNGNVFLEGLVHQLRLDPSLTADAYMSSVLGTASRKIHERDVIRIMADLFGIECDTPQPGELDHVEMTGLIQSIEHLRKTGGRYKNRLLCEHEARQFLLVHHRRRQNPHLRMKIWFVTTDYFITELQRLERDKYPLPISYTPRSWFQYLDLIDFENRGSQHFSKLQPKMRFGVVSGELGIEGIRTILKERKELIAAGVVSVKELAEAAVKEHHVRNSIAEYDRTVGSSRVEGSRKAAAKARIQRDMRSAMQGLVAVRTQELQRIEAEKASALNEANALKKKLAKSDYLVRTLKTEVRQRRKKRAGR